MRRILVPCLLGLLVGAAGLFAQQQDVVDATKLKDHSRPGFLKNLTIESFGYSSAPTGPGFESPTTLTPGPFTSHGLDCPRCTVRPVMERNRYTPPPFGAQATLKLWSGRAELFTRYSGVNAWKPDNTLIEPNRRGSSFNDSWMTEATLGGRVAVDRDQHLWLGTAGSYLEHFGEGKKHWNSYGASATFQFGR